MTKQLWALMRQQNDDHAVLVCVVETDHPQGPSDEAWVSALLAQEGATEHWDYSDDLWSGALTAVRFSTGVRAALKLLT